MKFLEKRKKVLLRLGWRRKEKKIIRFEAAKQFGEQKLG